MRPSSHARSSSARIHAAMVAGACALLAGGSAAAHHSYAMFDPGRTVTVSGTVAKFEWNNPHVYIWMYVPKAAGGYDLYAFENGSPNVLVRFGWSKTALQAGERISVDYAPLKDGRPGGHLLKATCADGRVLKGVGGPAGVAAPAGQN